MNPNHHMILFTEEHADDARPILCTTVEEFTNLIPEGNDHRAEGVKYLERDPPVPIMVSHCMTKTNRRECFMVVNPEQFQHFVDDTARW